MTCRDALRLIGRAIEGALPPRLLGGLMTHLEACESCRIEAENQVQVKRLLGDRPEEPLPDGLAAAIAARLDAEGAWPPRIAVDWRKLTLRLLPAAAALVLVAGALLRSHPAEGRREASLAAVWQQYVYGRPLTGEPLDAMHDEALVLLLQDEASDIDWRER